MKQNTCKMPRSRTVPRLLHSDVPVVCQPWVPAPWRLHEIIRDPGVFRTNTYTGRGRNNEKPSLDRGQHISLPYHHQHAKHNGAFWVSIEKLSLKIRDLRKSWGLSKITSYIHSYIGYTMLHPYIAPCLYHVYNKKEVDSYDLHGALTLEARPVAARPELRRPPVLLPALPSRWYQSPHEQHLGKRRFFEANGKRPVVIWRETTILIGAGHIYIYVLCDIHIYIYYIYIYD